MKIATIVVCLPLVWLAPVFGQGLPPFNDNPSVPSFGIKPPPGLRDWVPAADAHYQLYVNVVGDSANAKPNITILLDNKSVQYLMEKIGDTVYFFIAPPGIPLTTCGQIDSLENEFPIVILAGEQRRAEFWFSYDSSGQVTIDTSQASNSFISPLPVQDMPGDVVTLQLVGKNENAKVIRALKKELGDRATLVQLNEGFFRHVWLRVSKAFVQNAQTNETQLGTFLAYRCAPGSRDVVLQILAKYAPSPEQCAQQLAKLAQMSKPQPQGGSDGGAIGIRN